MARNLEQYFKSSSYRSKDYFYWDGSYHKRYGQSLCGSNGNAYLGKWYDQNKGLRYGPSDVNMYPNTTARGTFYILFSRKMAAINAVFKGGVKADWLYNNIEEFAKRNKVNVHNLVKWQEGHDLEAWESQDKEVHEMAKKAEKSFQAIKTLIQKEMKDIENMENGTATWTGDEDGSRVNAVIPPITPDGACLTIRKFGKSLFTLDKLVSFGSMSPEMMKFIDACVALRKNIVVSGGTGSGKTSLLNAISLCIGPTERIITVEDSLELKLQQSHVVRMEARPANAEGKGEVSIRLLVKNCLRMRPDRIVVGECRGGEALDMLQAMNTGHDGSLTTVHANTPSDTVARLETLCLMAGMDMPLSAIRAQIASAVSIIVQTARLSDGSRKTIEIAEVCGLDAARREREADDDVMARAAHVDTAKSVTLIRLCELGEAVGVDNAKLAEWRKRAAEARRDISAQYREKYSDYRMRAAVVPGAKETLAVLDEMIALGLEDNSFHQWALREKARVTGKNGDEAGKNGEEDGKKSEEKGKTGGAK